MSHSALRPSVMAQALLVCIQLASCCRPATVPPSATTLACADSTRCSTAWAPVCGSCFAFLLIFCRSRLQQFCVRAVLLSYCRSSVDHSILWRGLLASVPLLQFCDMLTLDTLTGVTQTMSVSNEGPAARYLHTISRVPTASGASAWQAVLFGGESVKPSKCVVVFQLYA